LKAAQRLVAGASGAQANLIKMGRSAGDAFEANTNVKEAYNKLFITQGLLDPKMLSDLGECGVTHLGKY
jgi:hypothetical protein